MFAAHFYSRSSGGGTSLFIAGPNGWKTEHTTRWFESFHSFSSHVVFLIRYYFLTCTFFGSCLASCGRLRFAVLCAIAWLHIVMRVLCCFVGLSLAPLVSLFPSAPANTQPHTRTQLHTLTWWPYVQSCFHASWRRLLHLMLRLLSRQSF